MTVRGGRRGDGWEGRAEERGGESERDCGVVICQLASVWNIRISSCRHTPCHSRGAARPLSPNPRRAAEGVRHDCPPGPADERVSVLWHLIPCARALLLSWGCFFSYPGGQTGDGLLSYRA